MSSTDKGFTLIELIIVVALLSILTAVVFPVLFDGSFEFGTTCKAGYKFSVDANGTHQQIFDENNRAIPCK
jgi:prepilin-type N-terminal cleavage/methylation domain-containing protein